MLAALSCQQPPLFCKHSLVSMSAKDNQRYLISILLSKKTTRITKWQLKDELIRFNLLVLIQGCLGEVRGERKKCQKKDLELNKLMAR